MTLRRILGSLGLVGAAVLACAGPFAAGRVSAAKLVTITGDGFSMQIPAAWKYELHVPLKQVFHATSLQQLAPSAVAAATADGVDGVVVVVQHRALSAAAIKSVEAAIFADVHGKMLTAPAYTASKSIVRGLAVEENPDHGNKPTVYAVAGITTGGKTYYLMSVIDKSSSAQSKADASEVLGVLGSFQ